MDGQLSIARLVLDASFVVQVVLLLLLGASLTSWTIIFRKRGEIGRCRKEADRFNHNYVGTEHLLLGLIKLGTGVAVNVLQKMGLDLETVRQEVEKEVRSGEQKVTGNIPYTPRVKKVLSLANKEAKALTHMYVGTEHILLGQIGRAHV